MHTMGQIITTFFFSGWQQPYKHLLAVDSHGFVQGIRSVN